MPNGDWPEIALGEDAAEPGYVRPENVKLLLDLATDSLKSQIEGVRQMFSRLGTVLAQSSALASGSAAAVFWLASHPVEDRPAWLIWGTVAASVSWTVSGALAIGGMAGAKFGAPGLDPREGYRQDVLGQSEREMQLWVLASHGGTLAEGQLASDRLRRSLNASITALVAAPLIASVVAAAVGLLF